MTTRPTILIALAAALAFSAGCSRTASDKADTAEVSAKAPADPAEVANAELAYDNTVRKADGDRNFAISKCTRLQNSDAMTCMNKADAEFAATRDRAKADLDAARM
jgi:hypothetical protein